MGDDGRPSREELERLLALASQSARSQEKDGHDWIMGIRYILDAIQAASKDVRTGSGASKTRALKFILDLRDRSFELIRDSRDLYDSKYLKKHEFKEILLVAMGGLDTDHDPPGWSPEGCVIVAHLVLTGSLLFPALAKREVDELGAKLYSDLGHDFIVRVKEPIERAEKILRAAGIDRNSTRNLLYVPEAMQKSREPKKKPKRG